MNKQDFQYCCNCLNAQIEFDGNKYKLVCLYHKKEVKFYDKPCGEYK